MIRDAHTLLGTDYWLSEHKPALAHRTTADDLRAQYARLDEPWHAYAAPFPSSRDGSFTWENAHLLEQIRDEPHIQPVLAVNPRNADSRQFVEAALVAGENVAALALWPIGLTAARGLDYAALARDTWLMDLAERFDVPLNVHVGAGNEQRIGRVETLGRYCPGDAMEMAAACPRVRFNLSHALRLSQSALRAALGLPNVYMDFSGISSQHRWYEAGENVFAADDAGDLAYLAGPSLLAALVLDFDLGERLMFASSYPFCAWWGFDVAAEVALVRAAQLSAEQERALFDVNANRFFRSASPRQAL